MFSHTNHLTYNISEINSFSSILFLIILFFYYFKKTLQPKKWVLATNNSTVNPIYDTCEGFLVTTAGTLVLIDQANTELDLGTVEAMVILPIVPYKVKTGSTAVIYYLGAV